VELAQRCRVVAGVGQRAGQGGNLLPQGDAVAVNPMLAWELPGHDRRPRRHTEWIGYIRPVEAHALLGHTVYVGGTDNRIAVAAQHVGPLLIGGDK